MKYFVVLVGAAITVTGCRAPEAEVETQAPILSRRDTVVVVADTLATVTPVDGTVESRQQTTVSTRMMARVTAVNIDVGSRVAAGQVVITLDAEDVAADRAKAEAAVRAATAARDEAQKNVARFDTLYAQDVVPMVQRDQARLNLTVAESQLTNAQAALSQVANAEGYTAIRAPFAGAVVRRHVNAGDLAVPGQPLLELTSDGPREAVFGIPPELVTLIEVGSPVAIDGGTLGSARATVRAIASGADARSRTIEVRASLPASWPTGIAITALVPSGHRSAVAIPEDAVVRRGQLTGVHVVTEGGEMLRWIRLGRRYEVPAPDQSVQLRVEVLSGLLAGERIVR